MSETKYIPALDGIRAVSIAIVIFSHFGFKRLIPGVFGVTVFFFVSGFLISRLLFDEHIKTGTINLRDFYIRRGLRLYPACLTMILVGGLIYTGLGGRVTHSDILAGVFYFANYHTFEGAAGQPHPVHILWSLSVEEHFYLVFPFLMFFLRKKPKQLSVVIVLMILAVTVWRFWMFAHGASDNRIDNGTDTRFDSILFGSLLAVLTSMPVAFDVMVTFLKKSWVIAGGFLCLLASFIIRGDQFRETSRFTIQGIGLFIFLGALIYGSGLGWIKKELSRPPLVLVGRWSYSLYLWHMLVLFVVLKMLPGLAPMDALKNPRSILALPVLIAISVGLACLSYYAVERPFVALRRRFGSHAATERVVRVAEVTEGIPTRKPPKPDRSVADGQSEAVRRAAAGSE
jgi:peptidoglycan/LPS O-acetylase OafA/YrhL